MKASHLAKVEERRKRVLAMMFPGEVPRGEVASPDDRLRELFLRLGGREAVGEGFPVRTAVANLRQLLEQDIPGLIAEIREANSRDPARCRYCGERYPALIVPAGTMDPDVPGGWICRDADGCEARIARLDAAPARQEGTGA